MCSIALQTHLIPFAFVAALLPVGMYRGLFSQSSEGDFLVDVQPLLLLGLAARRRMMMCQVERIGFLGEYTNLTA